ncbi:MAG: methyltransferase domain-containing protein [Verrucomicrobia bacterium]|nr:MAG: methyltransferase domain-containing protein [Verrucomicrobiota bacterium]
MQPESLTTTNGREAMFGHTACPVCRVTAVAFYAEVDGYQTWICHACGLLWLDPQPSDADLNTFYSNSQLFGNYQDGKSYGENETGLRQSARLRLRHLHGLAPVTNVMDIGCAMGFFLDEARHYTDQLYGIEFSRDVADVAIQRFHFSVQVGPAETVIQTFPENHFAWITLWATIEHVRQPLELLQQVHAHLAPGGHVALTTGLFADSLERVMGGRSQWISPPQHIWCFSRRSIVEALRRTGFANITVTPWITGRGVNYDKIYNSLRLLKHVLARCVGRLAVTRAGINRSGTEMLVVAQRGSA